MENTASRLSYINRKKIFTGICLALVPTGFLYIRDKRQGGYKAVDLKSSES